MLFSLGRRQNGGLFNEREGDRGAFKLVRIFVPN